MMKTDIQIAQEAELMHMETTKRSSPMNSGRT